MPDDRIETDTIVACSTAPGLGAIAVVRISGPEAWGMVRSLCPDLSETPPRVVRLTTIKDPDSGQLVDRALVTHFAAPASYTGEDMAELSCHGGWLSPALVEEAAVRLGCRRAEPGEFTRRAYLNGKVDLVQAEAVMDVVEGRSAALRRAALEQLESGLSGRLEDVRQGLIRLEAFLVQHIDFPEEDEAPLAVEAVADEADAVARGIEELLATAPEGELLREGAVTVLAGRPNAGKSSLFNALVGLDRAIVTPEPGTTRDAIEAVVSMGGYPFRLVDTAGIRDTGQEVERLGVEVSKRYLERADVILLCVEKGTHAGPLEQEFLTNLNGVPVVLVRTKSDIHPGPTGKDRGTGTEATGPGGVPQAMEVSVRTGEGLGELRHLLPSLVFRGLVEGAGEVPVLTRRRHADGLGTAAGEVRRFGEGLRAGLPAEVASTHLRMAETALEEVLGVIVKDEVLDLVFRDFCIGK